MKKKELFFFCLDYIWTHEGGAGWKTTAEMAQVKDAKRKIHKERGRGEIGSVHWHNSNRRKK